MESAGASQISTDGGLLNYHVFLMRPRCCTILALLQRFMCLLVVSAGARLFRNKMKALLLLDTPCDHFSNARKMPKTLATVILVQFAECRTDLRSLGNVFPDLCFRVPGETVAILL